MLMFRVLLPVLILALTYNHALAAALSIGHRGNSLFAPENTVASFRACEGKAHLVELDGRVTSDGQIVVMHDATVDRTTDGTGSVSALTLAQLRALDAGSWFGVNFTGERIPTLEESLTNILSFATPLIEQKTGSAALYVAELRRLNVISKVVVQSFDWNFLSAMRALEPGHSARGPGQRGIFGRNSDQYFEFRGQYGGLGKSVHYHRDDRPRSFCGPGVVCVDGRRPGDQQLPADGRGRDHLE